MNDEMLDPANDPANWDSCDEHETVFWKGTPCPKCEPEPIYKPPERCGKPVEDGGGIGTCCNDLGHEGECDDMPF